MLDSILGEKRFVSPEIVVSHFHLKEGDIVADYGAGSGFYTEILAMKVGKEGRVYACEIQKELVEKIGNIARTKGFQNVYPLWCDLEREGGIKIESGIVDTGLLINTLFQLEDKEAALKEIARTIRKGGKLCVVDWSESFGGLGPQQADVVKKEDAHTLIETCGFTYESIFDAGDHHYGVTFRKV